MPSQTKRQTLRKKIGSSSGRKQKPHERLVKPPYRTSQRKLRSPSSSKTMTKMFNSINPACHHWLTTSHRHMVNHADLRIVPHGQIPGTVVYVNIGEATVTLTTSYTTRTILISQCITRKSTGRGLQCLLPLAIIPH